MRVVGPAEVERSLDFPGLIDALRAAFAAPATVPRRSVHKLANDDSPDAFAVLPSWNEEHVGLKAFT